MKNTVTIAQIQTHVFSEVKDNLKQAAELVRVAAKKGADIVCLPEMFCCPYEAKNFPIYSEEEGGETDQFLAALAKECGIYLSAGSVPEKVMGEEGEKTYNTAYVYDREGNKIAKHRKVHLFDINVKGGQAFRESDTLTAGEQFTVFDTEFGTMGLAICFDIRFEETIRLMALKGAKVVLVPAAFNSTTGPKHWELSFRAHSMFNQLYMVGTSDALDEEASYHAWGHSILTDPWGMVVEQMGTEPGMMIHTIDLGLVDEVRDQLPILSARRTDLYLLEEIGSK